jgi:hypothetical protein
MLKLSPRGYVFIGLEVIREPLIKIIGKVLPNINVSWWNEYIYPQKVSFNENFPTSGVVNDLYKYLDELDCLQIMKKYHILFKTYIEYKEITELIHIRNACIHLYSKKYKKSIFEIADDTLRIIAFAMDKIDKEAKNTILSYRNEFYNQIKNERKIVATKNELIRFLEERVWEKSFYIFDNVDTIDKEEKTELINSMKKSCAYIKNELKTSSDVVKWFNDSLCSFEGIQMYLRLKNIAPDIPTFEDVRIGFFSKCYGEY